jgi:hypothetical protein
MNEAKDGLEIAATEQVLPTMIERGGGTILYTTGGTSKDPLAGPAEFTTTTIGSGAVRSYALKLHQATADTGVYVAHIPIFAWIGTGGPETQPETIAAHYWTAHTTRDGAEQPYVSTGFPRGGGISEGWRRFLAAPHLITLRNSSTHGFSLVVRSGGTTVLTGTAASAAGPSEPCLPTRNRSLHLKSVLHAGSPRARMKRGRGNGPAQAPHPML